MNFFGMGPMEIMVIMVVALIIFGPGKLPEIGAQVGRAIRDFRSATRELTGEFERTMNEVQGVADEVRQSALEVQDTTRAAVRLDQVSSPASAPARPLPAAAQSVAQTAPERLPSKADPLADLMFGGASDSVETAPSTAPAGQPETSGFTFPEASEPEPYHANGSDRAALSALEDSDGEQEPVARSAESSDRTVA